MRASAREVDVAAAARLLNAHRVASVAADPPRADGLDVPGGWTDWLLPVARSPRPYFSPYPNDALDRLARQMNGRAVDAWCIFDNTGSGAAASNALDLPSARPAPHGAPAAARRSRAGRTP